MLYIFNLSSIYFLLLLLLAQAFAQYPAFQDYVVTFKKTYASEEYGFRKLVYQQRIASFAFITDYTPGVNSRTDWTQEEINKTLTLQELPLSSQNSSKMPSFKVGLSQSIPTSLDWRTRNAVTSVKDQGLCGCCWSFATVAYAQSKLIIGGNYTVENIDLSEQYLLQCTPNSNCNGGYLEEAIQVVKTVPTQQQYPYIPYKSYNGICSATGIRTGYIPYAYYSLSDSQLISFLQTGPLPIAISSVNWISYSSGVFRCQPNSTINHAVLLVGYTESQWIIKNQWGTTWGENGYIRITRDVNNNCRIGSSIVYLFQGVLVGGLGVLLVLLLGLF